MINYPRAYGDDLRMIEMADMLGELFTERAGSGADVLERFDGLRATSSGGYSKYMGVYDIRAPVPVWTAGSIVPKEALARCVDRATVIEVFRTAAVRFWEPAK